MNMKNLIAVAAVAASTMAPLPSWAEDRTISADYTLAADETVDGIFTVESGVTVDLNGYRLTVKGVSGSGSIICTSDMTGILRVESDDNTANSSVNLSGNLKLVKAGGGTFSASCNYQSYTGGTEVEGGTFKYTTTGTLGQEGGANLVKNGGFESSTSSANYQYATDTAWANTPNWTCDGKNAGISKANGFWGGINVGTFAAYLRTGHNGTSDVGDGWFEQTIVCSRPGIYRLGFENVPSSLADRRGAAITITLTKVASGEEVFSFEYTASYSAKTYIDVPRITIAEPGTYVLRFFQQSGSKIQMTGFDDIVLEQVSGLNLLQNGTFDEGDGGPGCFWKRTADWSANPGWTAASDVSTTEYAALVSSGGADHLPSSVGVGKYAVILRTANNSKDSYIRQSVNVSEPGIYRFAFTYISCGKWSAVRGATVNANIVHGDDVKTVGSITTSGDSFRKRFEAAVSIPETGTYTIEFQQKGVDSSKCTLLDDVEFCRITSVTVGANGTIDLNSTSTHLGCQFVLAGGTIANPPGQALQYMFLTADSYVNVINTSGGIGANAGGAILDLGGHILDILDMNTTNPKFIRFFNAELSNGTIRQDGGTLRLGMDNGYLTMTNVNLEINNSALWVINEISVCDYKSSYNGTSNDGLAEMKVYGTFTPVTDYFYGCTLQNGATINLSERTIPLNTASSFSSGKNELEFAADAKITVDLSGRSDLQALARSASPYLVTWANPPSNGVVFVPDEATRANGYKVKICDEGLRLLPRSGLLFIVR